MSSNFFWGPPGLRCLIWCLMTHTYPLNQLHVLSGKILVSPLDQFVKHHLCLADMWSAREELDIALPVVSTVFPHFLQLTDLGSTPFSRRKDTVFSLVSSLLASLTRPSLLTIVLELNIKFSISVLNIKNGPWSNIFWPISNGKAHHDDIHNMNTIHKRGLRFKITATANPFWVYCCRHPISSESWKWHCHISHCNCILQSFCFCWT